MGWIANTVIIVGASTGLGCAFAAAGGATGGAILTQGVANTATGLGHVMDFTGGAIEAGGEGLLTLTA